MQKNQIFMKLNFHLC